MLKSLTQQLVPARCAPVEQVVEPDFHHLDIAVAGGERIAGEDRGRGWNEEGPVAQPEIVVFHLHRPVVREGVFEASAEQPAAGVVAAVGECAKVPQVSDTPVVTLVTVRLLLPTQPPPALP